ncbi:MAG: formyl transferase [Candidatus Sedimenticola sp. 6PFRAG5]
MKRIAILTGNELRHQFMRKALALIPGISVEASYCEKAEKSIRQIVTDRNAPGVKEELEHLNERERVEEDFFATFCQLAPNRSNPVVVPKNAINDPQVAAAIIEDIQPDLLVAYGCSIIKDPLLTAYSGRFLNVHLGLSPYYRGAGTNFWPLVNGTPEYVGATFMHLDAGIDTGEIIHQMRARVFPGDGPHQISNRLISQIALECGAVIRVFDQLTKLDQPLKSDTDRYYQNRDYSAGAVIKMRDNFHNGMISEYLNNKEYRCSRAPLVLNPNVQRELNSIRDNLSR